MVRRDIASILCSASGAAALLGRFLPIYSGRACAAFFFVGVAGHPAASGGRGGRPIGFGRIWPDSAGFGGI